ncbi:MAG: GDSL-type esterase/lipase family protein, partial [Planctomycetota bacterium]
MTASAPLSPSRERLGRTFRYVALGDSSTEGLDDPGGARGFRGWSERLATHLARARGPLHYANLAVRGRNTREVRDEQLERALALEPNIATLF